MMMKIPPTMMIHRLHPLLSSTTTRTRCLTPGQSSIMMDRVCQTSITRPLQPQPQSQLQNTCKKYFHWMAIHSTRYSFTPPPPTTRTTTLSMTNHSSPYRSFHFTVNSLSKDNKKDNMETAASSPPPAAIDHTMTEQQQQQQPQPQPSNDNEIPSWQNPRHYNNPEMKQIFFEDFPPGQQPYALPLPPFQQSSSSGDEEKVLAPPHIHDLAHQIVNLTLLELKELTNKIANHFEFDDSVMAASYSGAAGAGAGVASVQAEEQEEVPAKTVFDVKLIGFDAKAKIKIIKEVRAISGLGLKEAKELVESVPKVIQKDMKQDQADELKAKLEALGAQVEIL